MGTTEQKDLAWIQRAPVSFSGSATTTASPEAVFAILADHERWPEWFPVITKTEVLGPRREGVGMRRLTTIPGGRGISPDFLLHIFDEMFTDSQA